MLRHAVTISAVTILVLALLGCSGIKVTTNYNQEYDFKALESYAWLDTEPEILRDPLVDTVALQNLIKRKVENELNTRGYIKVESDPDFFITYHFGTESQVDVSACGYHYPDSPRCWGDDVETYAYTKGSLILDIIEPNDLELVWRGHATEAIYDPDTMDKTIGEAVHKVLARFPPKQ
jgi:hypothetical protein